MGKTKYFKPFFKGKIMQFLRLTDTSQQYYPEAIALYERNFITSERRDADEQRRVLAEGDYHFEVVLREGIFCGIVLFWETKKFLYLEHLCIVEEFRNQHIGHDVLDYLKSRGKIIYLEIEPIVDEITAKRQRFYESNGFFLNEHRHIQVKYRHEDDDLLLLIMTLGRTVSKEEYDEFYKYSLEKVQIQSQNVDELIICKPTKYDDLLAIAELIYYSDNYIYPYMFNGVEEGRRVIAQMILRDTIYSLDNLLIAKCYGKVVGVVAYTCDIVDFSVELFKECFLEEAVAFGDKQQKIYNDYYSLMKDDRGVYVANVCVSSACRGKGVATKLLQRIFLEGNFFHLECIQANVNAVKVYQKLGFEIVDEYPGVFDIPCCKMEKSN